ncbi:MAG TPA: type VI secretion system ATPase TssH [Planctomycetaceae bacterium]|nr:type VI secretion system ATPase TssH [Planctomycetaceae bacterium]|tara:strand:+ start:32645 stop:35380 length:2736 start_codon:yes stop_codon:yes gene_type:complete
MVQVNLKELIGKLSETGRSSLEGAAGLCLSRTNYNVEIEHWLLKILETPNSDVDLILRRYEIDSSRLSSDLIAAVDRFKRGNSRPPALSPNLVDLIRTAWLISSVDFGEVTARTGHLLCALLANGEIVRSGVSGIQLLESISGEGLRKDLVEITAESGEAKQSASRFSAADPSNAGPAVASSSGAALAQYTIDLTAHAKAGNIDPVLGRDSEIRQIIDILMRRRQNNPILTGEAGVGKTAVVEGFALRVAAGDVPEAIANVAIHSLDMGLLQAGAGMKGEFENRLKSVIDEVKASPTPIVLFIDEAHTLIGAGGSGQNDAANLLKPALARGELRTVAATTWAEYKKYFEKDAALARRFQVVKVEEPGESAAVEMIRGLTTTLESHHQVRILNEAVVDAVKLSNRYISGRQLPDKAVSLLDTSCARIRMSQAATPPAVEDCQRRIEQLELSIQIFEREMATGSDHTDALAEHQEQAQQARQELAALQERWQQELALVETIRDRTGQLNPNAATPTDKKSAATAETESTAAEDIECAAAPPTTKPLTAEERERLKTELIEAEQTLEQLQGDVPLVHPCVNASAIAETVASWTGIPVGRMVADEVRTVLELQQRMEQSIVGQSHALERIAQSIRTSRANLSDPRTPIGVFLLAGTSGVGKTETAITLANLLYGGEQNMTTINMSEFKEEHKVSLLMGSPPGYVGYGEGGVLTEAVRRRPYSVVLLDEMEKAHPGVQDVFYQVFDKGTMKDGEGRDIDFKNTVILMTTNAGTDLIKNLCLDPDTRPEPDSLMEALFPELLKTFKPAFLGRLDVVPYFPLTDEVLQRIVRLKLDKVGRQIGEHYRADFHYSDALVEAISARCTEVDTGARNVDHILTRSLLPYLSADFLARMADDREITQVQINVQADGQFDYQIS